MQMLDNDNTHIVNMEQRRYRALWCSCYNQTIGVTILRLLNTCYCKTNNFWRWDVLKSPLYEVKGRNVWKDKKKRLKLLGFSAVYPLHHCYADIILGLRFWLAVPAYCKSCSLTSRACNIRDQYVQRSVCLCELSVWGGCMCGVLMYGGAIGRFPGRGGMGGAGILVWDRNMLPGIFSWSGAGTVTSV